MNEELKEFLERAFNQKIVDIQEISGGWLTEKWKVQFKELSIMLKIIEHKKIIRRDINIELAANLLKTAYDFGIKCPCIYKINDKLIHNLSKKSSCTRKILTNVH